jgi:hypothetical protein
MAMNWPINFILGDSALKSSINPRIIIIVPAKRMPRTSWLNLKVKARVKRKER